VAALAIADAGPLYAAADRDDSEHGACRAVLARRDLRLVVPALVIAEATYFVAKHLGARAESAFLRGIGELDIELPTVADFARMGELVERYADFPLGGTDASVVATAERLGAAIIVTLDRRHFGAIAPRHRDSFELLP
jgi:uncharacterized protein